MCEVRARKPKIFPKRPSNTPRLANGTPLTVSQDQSASLEKAEAQYPYLADQNGEFEFDDDLHVQCPPHTTERKLIAKIDWHVLPYLCILYLLAFLDR